MAHWLSLSERLFLNQAPLVVTVPQRFFSPSEREQKFLSLDDGLPVHQYLKCQHSTVAPTL
jgi:hypothetical protein